MPVIVIGGGITGLSAAWNLVQQGRETILIEPGPFGGLLRTEHIDGCTVECGADSWIRTKTLYCAHLATEVGLAQDIISCNDDVRRTFIFSRWKAAAVSAGVADGSAQRMATDPLLPLNRLANQAAYVSRILAQAIRPAEIAAWPISFAIISVRRRWSI